MARQDLRFSEKPGYGLGATASSIGYQANVEQTEVTRPEVL